MKPGAACFLASCALMAAPAAASGWPDVKLPSAAQHFDVGQQMTVNGLPMRVRGFLSPESPATLAAWFRASLGSPLVESRHDGKTILGRPQGAYYLTVQIEAVGSGTRGLVAHTAMPAMMAGAHAAQAMEAHWQARLPAGVRIMSAVRMRDGERDAQHLVLESPHSLAYSRDALTRLLRQDGYAPGRIAPGATPPGETLYFHAPGRVAMAVLTRNGDGATDIMLSTTNAPEGAR